MISIFVMQDKNNPRPAGDVKTVDEIISFAMQFVEKNVRVGTNCEARECSARCLEGCRLQRERG
jgi:hypothetical protein